MWDLIVSVPDHCSSFYFTKKFLKLLNHKLASSETFSGTFSFLMNTVLLKFQNFALRPEVCEMGGNLELAL